jgi:Porin PorA
MSRLREEQNALSVDGAANGRPEGRHGLNRAGALRLTACGILGFGAALLIAALLLSTYTAGRIAKIPLDIDTTLVSTGTATALDPASLSTDRFVANNNVPVVQQQQYSTESGVETPSNADFVTLQVGTTLRRTDKQQETGLLLAIVDSVTLNRKTAMAVSSESNPAGWVQKPRTMDDTKPPTSIPLKHEGLNYRFPFNVEKKTYPYFDPIAQKVFDANYDGEEDVLGLTAYHFTQNVGLGNDGKLAEPVEYPSLYDRDEDATVSARGALWGLPGPPDEQVTMKRYYAARREFWVDPVSGTIVKTKERALHYYVRCGDPECKARDPLKPDVTLVDYTVTSNEATVESRVNAARDERDRLALWGRVLPISFTALGIIGLVGGALLAWFSLRADTALIDPGLDTADHGFFRPRGPSGEPVPGAEAETEKLPTQRRPPSQSGPPSP